MFEQGPGNLFRLCGGHGNFKTVLTGITGAGNDAGDVVQRNFQHVHELHFRHAGPKFGQNRFRAWSLQRDQRPIIEKGNFAVAGKMRLHMSDIGVLAGRVDDDEKMIAAIGDHQVI
ncbi:hypothetical protein D3C87_1612560 [compost metagenome]